MEKIINVGGRLHNPVVGGALTGANEIKDDTKGKMQNVINQETDAELVRLDEAKQDKMTFDQTPTEGSTNPVTSGGVYAADAALQQAIEAILLLIPSAATALNQLADKAFVNSSIATATATFRGTYNLVTDLGLTVSATHQQIATALASVVSTADNNDYCFVQIPVSDQSTDIRVTERYKFDGTSWEYEYDLNNSGFTADQWGAINSGITSVLVGKLGGLPTAQELAAMFAGKQNTLTFDSTPVAGSDNPVKSSGLYNAFAAINAIIPEGANANNKLVAESRLVAYVTTLINALDATFNVTSADGHVTLRMTQADGVITSVQILTSDIASESALTTLIGRVSTAESDIDALQDAYAALTQSDVVIVEGALPSTGQQNIIYRQIDQDHTPPQFYSDYMWNGTTWVLMATYMNGIDPRPKKGSQNLVTSGGIFDNMGALDVSELNATENPHTLAIYADLSAALAAIPSDYQKGGMSIKFVQSSDNKYVQYFLKSQIFSSDESDWQSVESLFNEKASGVSHGSWGISSIELDSGKYYTVKNTGGATIGYFSLRTSSENILVITDILPGEIRPFILSQDCVEVRAFSSPESSWTIYDSTSFVTKAFEPSVTEEDIVNISGNALNKVVSQNLLRINNDTAIIDCPDELRGILRFLIKGNLASSGHKLKDFEKYRINGFIHNSDWFIFLSLQGLFQGSWEPVDNITIQQNDAPTNPENIEIIESNYGGFKVWINWSNIGTYSSTSLELIVKDSAVSYIGKYLDDKIDYIRDIIDYGDYEKRDYIKHTITVGTGKDYTTISAAYAAITDSAYDNQYAVVVYPGTYNEKDLTPPKYTHTYGLDRDTTIVTSENLGGTDPVFNQVRTSKLSNLTVISYTGYCIHQDQSSLQGCLLVNTNLHCRKEYGVDVSNLGWRTGQTNPSVLGDGAHIIGTRFVWNDSIFENGYCAIHTIGRATPSSAEYANQQISFNNCKLVNAIIQPLVLSKLTNFVDGLFNCEINGLTTQKGFPSIVIRLATRGTGDTTYNYVWNILGGNNKNFAVEFNNTFDPLKEDCWEKVNTNDKTLVQLAANVSVQKYDIITISGTKANSSTKSYEVLGFALVDGSDTIPVWVGDALAVNLSDGEYGIGADGTLSSSATDKIGFVTNGYFYKY